MWRCSLILTMALLSQGCATGMMAYAYRRNKREIREAAAEKRMVWWKKCEEEGDERVERNE